MAWNETEKGSARTAASSEMPSGTGMSMESCAASRSAQAPGAPGDDADVDAGTEVSLGEAPAEAEVARLAGRAGRVDAPRSAGQPRVEHDTLAHVEAPRLGPERNHLGHHLVPGHVGKRGEGSHRVVDIAGVEVTEHQLGVGAADARKDGFGDDPVGPDQAGLVDLVQAERRLDQFRLELVLRRGPDLILGGWCSEQQCLHDAASPCACCVKDRIPSRKESMSVVLASITAFMSGR